MPFEVIVEVWELEEPNISIIKLFYKGAEIIDIPVVHMNWGYNILKALYIPYIQVSGDTKLFKQWEIEDEI